MFTYLLTMGIILLLLLGWISVQQLARLFALRHPELGPCREDGGCGTGSCSCGKASSCHR